MRNRGSRRDDIEQNGNSRNLFSGLLFCRDFFLISREIEFKGNPSFSGFRGHGGKVEFSS